MLDYNAISALHAVIQTQGFDAAAKKLFITQSAVSQRIKSLEHYYGKPVLLRTPPYRPTELGNILLGHYSRLILLEDTLKEELSKEVQSQHISIAINRDSLETWFQDVINQLNSIREITLEIISDDQEVTIDYLKKGLVSTCLSTSQNAITGCQSQFLGYMDYILVSSPDFKRKFFTHRSHKKNLLHAPAIIFDNKDKTHENYIKHFFNITEQQPVYHVVPSVQGFRQFAINGYAYGLIPKIDITKELKNQTLIDLFPDKKWRMPLYWHSWQIETAAYKAFNRLVIEQSEARLAQK